LLKAIENNSEIKARLQKENAAQTGGFPYHARMLQGIRHHIHQGLAKN
jgi:hypothetical protein